MKRGGDTKEESLACPVCCDKFTKATRKKVICANCEYVACMACNQRYLTQNVSTECMSCQHPWDRDVLNATFPHAWVSGPYTRHREKVLLDGEMARLPESQEMVTNYRLSEELKAQVKRESEERAQLIARIGEISRSKWNISNRIHRIKQGRFLTDGNNQTAGAGSSNESSRAAFVRKCPVETCRGFLSTALKCGVCDTFACGQCLGIVGPTRDTAHTCHPDDIETAKLIKKDCKGCPKCATIIHKIDGCDQMWCTQCHTAFSWRTGQAIRDGSVVHNPHYYAFLRTQNTAGGNIPRTPGDIGGCPPGVNRYPVVHELERAIPQEDRRSKERDAMFAVHRTARHLELWECHNLARGGEQPDHYDLRLRYLLGELSMDHWKRLLVLREKKRAKEIALRQIYETYIAVTCDTFRGFVFDAKTMPIALQELRAISIYTKKCLADVCHKFKCTAYTIHTNF